MTLKDKVAIVTGGNSAIGKAIALGLAKAGASIVIDYIADPDATNALEREIGALGDKAIGVDADVGQIGDLQKLIAAAVAEFGRVDVMVNNAGVETRTSVLDTTEAQYDRVLAINLKSAFFGTQIAAQQMLKRRTHLIAEDSLTPKRSAAAHRSTQGRDARAERAVDPITNQRRPARPRARSPPQAQP
jgi:glucose 1-dehydrogenase